MLDYLKCTSVLLKSNLLLTKLHDQKYPYPIGFSEFQILI